MKRCGLVLITLIISSSILFLGINPLVNAQGIHEIDIAVAIAPLGGIVDKIGGAFIATSILLTEGVEPHAFTVDPSIIAIADNADLLVLTGHYHWEEDLANQTSTPFISLDNPAAMERYEDFGAALSPMPGVHAEGESLDQHDHEEGNPHAYWLLPRNAIAIANATTSALAALNTTLADVWLSNFNDFVSDIDALRDLVAEADSEYGFSEMHAVVVFPAEAYVAEAFGIEVEAALIQGSQTITGDELLQVQNALRNGSIELILGSDVSRLQAGGEFAEQLVQDYGGKLIWWRAVFFSGLSDYVSVMTYNLGALTSGLEGESSPGQTDVINVALIALAIVLAVFIAIETVVLIVRARAE